MSELSEPCRAKRRGPCLLPAGSTGTRQEGSVSWNFSWQGNSGYRRRIDSEIVVMAIVPASGDLEGGFKVVGSGFRGATVTESRMPPGVSLGDDSSD